MSMISKALVLHYPVALPIFPPRLTSVALDVPQCLLSIVSGPCGAALHHRDKDRTVSSALLPLTLVHGGLGEQTLSVKGQSRLLPSRSLCLLFQQPIKILKSIPCGPTQNVSVYFREQICPASYDLHIR